MMSGGRYPVLRTIAILYLVGAAVTAITGLFLACWCRFVQPVPWGPVSFTPAISSRLIAFIAMLGATFLGVISMFAIAEVIKLFIDGVNSLRLMAYRSMSLGSSTAAPQETVVVTGDSDTLVIGSCARKDGTIGGRLADVLEDLDDETAEAALIRGH